MALIMVLTPEDNEPCGGCFAYLAIGLFDVADVETPLCSRCSTFRTADGSRVILTDEPV